MYKTKLSTSWTLVSESINKLQLRSNSNSKIAVYIGDTPNDNIFFLLDNNYFLNITSEDKVWCKSFDGLGAVLSEEDIIKSSCFLPDGSFDCSGFLVANSLVYC